MGMPSSQSSGSAVDQAAGAKEELTEVQFRVQSMESKVTGVL